MIPESISAQISAAKFLPHPALKNSHSQTIISSMIPRHTPRLDTMPCEPRVFAVTPEVRLVALCSWQPGRKSHPTVVLLHGLEGSTESRYMRGTAEKALASGFNVVRLNFRNCGGTEHLGPTLYHAGLSDDVKHVVEELTDRDGLDRIYLAGFSMGGNIALKLVGQCAGALPDSLRGVVAVSPSIDLTTCIGAIELRSNVLYHLRFVWNMRTRMRRKARLFPDRYDESQLKGVWSIRRFDDVYTAPHMGFIDADDYYRQASAFHYITRITIPSLIIQARDDPFIPFSQFERDQLATNPNLMLLAPDQGGHVGFFSAEQTGEDRFWAESRAVEFIGLLDEASVQPSARLTM